jgi:UDP:flavonoid glycosyltransferase YjiC (YdhE family)
VHVTGYWFLDRPTSWEPPNCLVEFLAAGPPPVYVRFGGRPSAEAAMATVLEALRRAACRGIVEIPPEGRLTETRSDVLVVGSTPHDWLFPQLAAVVHHGGAGTTAAALRAGVPSVVVPEYADQPFWARRVHELGAGPRPIDSRQLSAERLAHAIAATRDPKMHRRVNELAACIRSEDGVARAVEAFERATA